MELLPRKRNRNQLTRLHDEMDDLFHNFFGLGTPFTKQEVWPAIDISENENEIVLNAEVPGCKAEDIDISVHGNTLTLSGEKKHEEEKEEKGCYHMERSYGSFRRDLTLPSDVDAEKVDASCKNGVLKVKLPKAERAKAKKIKIKGD